jgi:hypothetical protein
MKQSSKPFLVEIKKSRVQGQRTHLPPRPLFATVPAEATKVLQKEEPQVVPEPSAAPRILPSIVEPVWTSSEPVETARRKRPSVDLNREQMELNLDASASEDVADAPAAAPVSTEAMPQTDGALDVSEDTGGVNSVQPAQGEGVRVKSRKPQKKGSGTVEQEITSSCSWLRSGLLCSNEIVATITCHVLHASPTVRNYDDGGHVNGRVRSVLIADHSQIPKEQNKALEYQQLRNPKLQSRVSMRLLHILPLWHWYR